MDRLSVESSSLDALRRLEEAAALHSAEDHRLCRSLSARKRHAESLLRHAAEQGNAAHLSAVHQLKVFTQQQQNQAMALRQKVLFAQLWDQMVVREWFIPIVRDGFFVHIMHTLTALHRRLKKVSKRLCPSRRVRCAIPPAWCLSTPSEYLPAASSLSSFQTFASSLDSSMGFSGAPEVMNGMEESDADLNRLWKQHRRPLRSALYLAIAVVQDFLSLSPVFTNDQTIFHDPNDANSCTTFHALDNHATHRCSATESESEVSEISSPPLTPAALEEMLRLAQSRIQTTPLPSPQPDTDAAPIGGTRKDPREVCGAFMASILASPDLLSALASDLPGRREHAALCRTAARIRFIAERHEWCAGVMRSFFHTRTRATRDAIVARRQQQEWVEAQWRSQRTRVAAALRDLSEAAPNTSRCAFDSAETEDAALDTADCPLWMVLQHMRQRRQSEEETENS